MPPDDCFHRLKNLSVNLSCYTLFPIQYCLRHSQSVNNNNNNTLSQLLMARLLPNTFKLNKSEKNRKKRKKSTRAAEERKASVRLISHGATLPRAVLVVVVLTDEAWLWLTWDGLLTKVLNTSSSTLTHYILHYNTTSWFPVSLHPNSQFLPLPVQEDVSHLSVPLSLPSSSSPLSLLLSTTSSLNLAICHVLLSSSTLAEEYHWQIYQLSEESINNKILHVHLD